MPIFMKIDGVQGRVTDHDHKNASSNGGVWKTTSFPTARSAAGPGGGPHVKVFGGSNSGGLLQISRLSLTSGAGGVEGTDPTAAFKIEQLVNTARTQRTPIKVFICPTDPAASAPGSQGRLLLGTEQGVWRSAAGRKPHVPNNIKQMPLPALNRTTVEIIVTNAGGMVISTHRLQNSSVSRHSGGVLVCLGDGSVKF